MVLAIFIVNILNYLLATQLYINKIYIDLMLVYSIMAAILSFKSFSSISILLGTKIKNLSKDNFLKSLMIIFFISCVVFILGIEPRGLTVAIVFLVIIKSTDLYFSYVALINEDIYSLIINNEDASIKLVKKAIDGYKAKEKSRNQLAKFLHDDILQDIIFTKNKIENIYDELNILFDNNTESTSYDSNWELIKNTIYIDNLKTDYLEINESIDKVISNIRNNILLYNPMLENSEDAEKDIYELLLSLTKRFKTPNKHVELIIDLNNDINYPLSSFIYRIAHELLSNSLKHSKGNNITLLILVRYDKVYINIANFGDQFFDINSFNPGHYGLAILKEDIFSFGGNITSKKNLDEFPGEYILKNNPGESSECTNILVTLPVKIWRI